MKEERINGKRASGTNKEATMKARKN